MNAYCIKLNGADLYFRCHESDGGLRLTPYNGVAIQCSNERAAAQAVKILNRMYPGLDFEVEEIVKL